MLGVLPAWRGRGIATQLITHALGQAAARGVRSARSVVASGNVASQRAFERAGFRALASPGGAASSLVHAMLVYAIGGLCPQPLPPGWEVRLTANDACEHLELDHQSQLVGAAECLRVQTLCYSGLWVERLAATSDRALGWLARAVVERAKSLDLHEVGYLAPQAEPRATDARAPRCLPLVREGYADRGDYYVYTAVWP
jgi:hypothetical protein